MSDPGAGLLCECEVVVTSSSEFNARRNAPGLTRTLAQWTAPHTTPTTPHHTTPHHTTPHHTTPHHTTPHHTTPHHTTPHHTTPHPHHTTHHTTPHHTTPHHTTPHHTTPHRERLFCWDPTLENAEKVHGEMVVSTVDAIVKEGSGEYRLKHRICWRQG